MTYGDTIDHLSESERAVTGIVFALAGYLVHNLHESVPFMVLDSMQVIGAERIASLVEYFEQKVTFWWLPSSRRMRLYSTMGTNA